MKTAKKIFYGLMILCMLLCGVVLLCAMIPGLTGQVAAWLYGPDAAGREQEVQNTTEPDYVVSESSTPGIDWENMPFQNSPYVFPARDQLLIPISVDGRSDYQGIRERTQEIGEEEAEQLDETPDLGELGTDLSFHKLYYPYYAMLTEPMQKIYCQVYANAKALKTDFQPVEEVRAEQFYTVFEAVSGDHPELFWMETSYKCKIAPDGKIAQVSLVFNDLADHLESAKLQFELAGSEILTGAESLATDLEKELYVHDVLAGKADYLVASERNQSAYSALVDGSTVCAGYSRAFQYLLQQLGIPCYYCTGFSGEDHAWNILYVDGKYRNVDVTWDDTEELTYDYYNKSDLEFSSTHMRKSLSVYLPGCPGEEAAEGVSPLDGISGLINPNPIKPITLADRGEIFPSDDNATAKSGELDPKKLREAGLKASDVLLNLDAYYDDCERKLKEAGAGQIQFANCIPESLWDSIENAYTSGGYRSGYVESALKELKKDDFAINLQVVKIGGGFCRLYHYIVTW